MVADPLQQEGLKAHEAGQHQQNPFDMFSNFFGREHRRSIWTLNDFN
jgi:hypothetical protein